MADQSNHLGPCLPHSPLDGQGDSGLLTLFVSPMNLRVQSTVFSGVVIMYPREYRMNNHGEGYYHRVFGGGFTVVCDD